MEIFLAVLRVTGIVLLCILAFILLLVLLLLFCPYPYRVDVKKEEKLTGRVRLRWLFFFLIADLTYDDGMNLRIRILGIPIYDKKKKAEKAKKKEEARRQKEKKKDDGKKPEGEKNPAAQPAEDKNSDDKPSVEGKTEEKKEEKKAEDKKAAGEKADEERSAGKKRESIGEKAEKALEKIESFLEELPEKLEERTDKLVDKLEEAYKKLEFRIRLLESSGTAWVVAYVKKRVIGILKSIRPTRLDGDISVKSEDPATVAKVYECYALALPMLLAIKGNVTVEAEQDESELRAELHLKGRILLECLLWHAGLLLFNKKVKTFWKLLKEGKQEEEKDGGK